MTIEKREFDVVVAGGGPAGVAAAISASRAGARTALIEASSAFGGMATNGLVPTLAPYTDQKDIIIRGIGLEVLQGLLERGAAIPKPDPRPGEKPPYDWTTIDAEALKLLLDEMVVASGAEPRLFTTMTEPVMDGQRITAVHTWSKSGREEWRAGVFVDATGDADLAARAGCPFDKGDATGLMQPSTLCFLIAGLKETDHIKWARTNPFFELTKAASLSGELSGRNDLLCINGMATGNAARFNYKHQKDTDGNDADSITRAIIEGRRQSHELCRYLRDRIPGCEEAFVAATGNLLGIRETRRIVGEYVLTMEHYFERRKSADDIADYCREIDLHAVGTPEELKQREHPHAGKTLPEGEHYGIPYRTLIPQSVSNLLVAGRAISCDRGVLGSIRQMPAVFATGQAAGFAAGLAAQGDGAVRNVDVRCLQDGLIAQGAYIELAGQN